MKKDIIVVRNGSLDKAYYKLIQFKDKTTGKEFIIYTDLLKDDNGALKLYSSILKKEDDVYIYVPVEEDRDREAVEKAIIKVKLQLEKK